VISDRNVFNNDIFISLSAVERGGAIYTKSEVSIMFCKFANNSAGNNEGNDLFADITSSYYSIASSVDNVCSVSITPGRIVIGNLVCKFYFE
jgi:predicted outer membrane repeat protein